MNDARKLRITRMALEAEGVLSLRFSDPSGEPLPSWEPGSHLALNLPLGIVREYSLCSEPDDPTGWTVAVLHEPSSRGGSEYVHLNLRVGEYLHVEGPRNNFRLEDAPKYQLIAGGIGITPIYAMARELQARGVDWNLLYAGRSAASMAFIDELTALAPDRVRVHADDEAGGPPDLAALLGDKDPETLVYCCGPEPLLNGVEAALGGAEHLRIERFKAPDPIAPPPGGDQPFEIVCAGSGKRVTVPVGTTALDALEAAGFPMPSSCTEGICGTCETKVVAGKPDHRDFLLTDTEKETGDTIFICVSRSLTPELTLVVS